MRVGVGVVVGMGVAVGATGVGVGVGMGVAVGRTEVGAAAVVAVGGSVETAVSVLPVAALPSGWASCPQAASVTSRISASAKILRKIGGSVSVFKASLGTPHLGFSQDAGHARRRRFRPETGTPASRV